MISKDSPVHLNKLPLVIPLLVSLLLRLRLLRNNSRLNSNLLLNNNKRSSRHSSNNSLRRLLLMLKDNLGVKVRKEGTHLPYLIITHTRRTSSMDHRIILGLRLRFHRGMLSILLLGSKDHLDRRIQASVYLVSESV